MKRAMADCTWLTEPKDETADAGEATTWLERIGERLPEMPLAGEHRDSGLHRPRLVVFLVLVAVVMAVAVG